MKRIIVGLSSMVFILFVGCGGDSKQAAKPPKVAVAAAGCGQTQPVPPPCTTGFCPQPIQQPCATGQCQPQCPGRADDQRTEEAIAHWAQESNSQCSQSACQFAQQTGPVLVQSVAYPGGIPLQQNPQIQSALNGGVEAGRQGCVYALTQLLLNMKSARGGTYSQDPQVRQWFENAVVRPIGTAASQCLPQGYAIPGFLQGAVQLGGLYANNLSQQVGGVPQWASAELNNGFNNQTFTGGNGF